MNCLLEILIFLIVRIVSLHVLAEFFVQLYLNKALFLDSLVSELDSFEHISLAYFVHFTLDHHNVVICGCNHEFEVTVLHFAEGRVNLEFTIDSGDTYFRDRSFERNVTACKSCRSGKSSKCIRLCVSIS